MHLLTGRVDQAASRGDRWMIVSTAGDPRKLEMLRILEYSQKLGQTYER
jgi:hypothetical protein